MFHRGLQWYQGKIRLRTADPHHEIIRTIFVLGSVKAAKESQTTQSLDAPHAFERACGLLIQAAEAHDKPGFACYLIPHLQDSNPASAGD